MNLTSIVNTTPAPARDSARPSWRVTALSIVGFWLFYFALNTVHYSMANEPDQLGSMGRRALVSLAGIGLSTLLCLLLRAADHRSTRLLVAAALVASAPIALAYATINYAAFYVVAPLDSALEMMARMPAEKRDPMRLIFDSAFNWYFFVVAWAILYIALTYAAKVAHAERTAAAYRAEAQTAQLRALRYQINPHFLFNTLNSLSSLVLRGRVDEAEHMIMNLSTFFRTSLADEPTADVALADEIRLQSLYLDIERVRFPERLIVDIDVPPELARARVPGMILQPLVENAIKYGVSRTNRPVTVAIWARAPGGRLHLVVEDDGDAPTRDGASGHGVGLRNVGDRLAARYGRAAECHWGPGRDGGWRAELVVPLGDDL